MDSLVPGVATFAIFAMYVFGYASAVPVALTFGALITFCVLTVTVGIVDE